MNVRRGACAEKAATLAWTVRRRAMYSSACPDILLDPSFPPLLID
jgi:hypothetical protein